MQTNTLTTTASRDFFPCSGGDKTLFAVRPGIDAFDALEMASCLLSAAHNCAYESMEAENLSIAAAYLTDMAKAVVDSVMLGSKSTSDDRQAKGGAQ